MAERDWSGGIVRYPDPAVEVLDPRFLKYRVQHAAVERIATGCRWAEGPVWFGDGRYLLWSDIPNDRVMRWTEESGQVSVFRAPSHNANGNTRDRQGRLVTCEHDARRVTRTEHDGTVTVLIDRHGGKRLNAPNDVVVTADGAVWFTDPGYGILMNYEGHRAEFELPANVYRVAGPPGGTTVVIGDLVRPNGLCFSLDGRRLFVNDTARKHIRVFDVKPDGGLANGRVWAETTGDGPGAPDGMKLDSAGNVYCCGPGGIHVFTPEAACLGVIHVPERTANFAWGDDYRSLYITASTSVYRIRTTVPGLPSLQAGDRPSAST